MVFRSGLVFTIFLCCALVTKAQLVAVPVSQPTTFTHSNARVQALQLPFFDDFSTVRNNTPDPALWTRGGGVYVNNTMTLNHPSINVVTFDGADASGRPYNASNTLAQGATDTLTSQAIDLSKLTPKDSLYLSFYWQIRGGGELPDATDSLEIQGLTVQGTWEKVWSKKGGTPNAAFVQTLVALKTASFFHANFQFRFRSFGRQSGAFDTWHIDYVYLNKNRTFDDRFVKDVTCRSPLTPFLKRYTAMPLAHYKINPAAETADSTTAEVQNLFNNFNIPRFNFTIKNELTKDVYQSLLDVPLKPAAIGSLEGKTISIKNEVPTKSRLDALKKVTLVSKFELKTTDNDNPSIVGVDLRRNDTISRSTVLDDFYAYDDGSAEYAAYMSRPLGRVAVRYVMPKADTIGAVRMSLVPILKDISGQSFTIQLYANDRGKPGKLLEQESFKVAYPAQRSGFVEFDFKYGVAIKDTFFVAWQQIGQDPIAVGLDRNTRREDQIFVNLGQEWAPYTDFKNDASLTYFTGSLMVRPVVRGKTIRPVLSVEKNEPVEWILYPNPTQGVVAWIPNEATRLEVWNSAGALIQQKILEVSEKSINLSHLPDGTYLIRLSNDNQSVMKKVLLRK